MRPLARRDELLLQNIGDQLVVYDQKRRRLHVLNRSAALVWRHCDGHRDVAQLAETIGRELGTPGDNEVILLALQQLDEAQLLKRRQSSTPQADSVSRREMMSRALGGLAAGVLMPMVTSCGSILDSTIGVVDPSNVSILVVTTTLPPNTTTTLPPNTTTTTTTLPPNTTTTTTTLPPTTTTTTTTHPPHTTTTTTTHPPHTTTTTTTLPPHPHHHHG